MGELHLALWTDAHILSLYLGEQQNPCPPPAVVVSQFAMPASGGRVDYFRIARHPSRNGYCEGKFLQADFRVLIPLARESDYFRIAENRRSKDSGVDRILALC